MEMSDCVGQSVIAKRTTRVNASERAGECGSCFVVIMWWIIYIDKSIVAMQCIQKLLLAWSNAYRVFFGIKSLGWCSHFTHTHTRTRAYTLTLIRCRLSNLFIIISSGAFQLEPHSSNWYQYTNWCWWWCHMWALNRQIKRILWAERVFAMGVCVCCALRPGMKREKKIRNFLDWYRSDCNVVMCKLNFMPKREPTRWRWTTIRRPAIVAYVVQLMGDSVHTLHTPYSSVHPSIHTPVRPVITIVTNGRQPQRVYRAAPAMGKGMTVQTTTHRYGAD